MKQTVIRLTEQDLHNIITECVRKQINEVNRLGAVGDPTEEDDDDYPSDLVISIADLCEEAGLSEDEIEAVRGEVGNGGFDEDFVISYNSNGEMDAYEIERELSKVYEDDIKDKLLDALYSHNYDIPDGPDPDEEIDEFSV